MESTEGYLKDDEKKKYTEDDIKYTDKLVELLEKELSRLSKQDYSRRIFSPMMHAFLEAEFVVDTNLPQELRVGLFEKPGEKFVAKMRYASAYRKNKIIKKDVRTLAIRVYHKDREINQDFLLGSSPHFRSRTVKQTYLGLKLLFSGGLMILLGIIIWPYVALMALKSRKKTLDLFNIPFYSQTAYTFGNEKTLVKYIVKPKEEYEFLNYPDYDHPDYLKNVMKKRFHSLQFGQKVILDVYLQFQTPEDTKPEDPVVVWNGPLTHVATIRIPKQVFDTKERVQEGQDMEYNVGNSLPEHKYFGAMNWARHVIYEKLAEYRRNVRERQLKKESKEKDLKLV
ncbi:hypothetical protein [Sporocytophaga myxococcoides]|uniref:hypothetical protein n=1 Tax=Sporocytophaga myxococcoides TaxID=153721 RepID=UPI00041E99F9|nr:hypothetical protein [Sporocytophaga myxococcoides]